MATLKYFLTCPKIERQTFVPEANVLTAGVSCISFYNMIQLVARAFGREVWGPILKLVKSDTVLPTFLHCCDIFSKEAVFQAQRYRNDFQNSLHASV